MKTKIIRFPEKLDNHFSTYTFLGDVQNQMIDSEEKIIVLDMRECKFIHAIFTSYLGALVYVGRKFSKMVQFCTLRDSKLEHYLKESGLYEHFVPDDHTDNSNAIPFRQINLDEDFIIGYIDNILDLAPITLTDQAQEVLFKNIYEIFNNAVDHARSDMGVFACGHWMPGKKYLTFSVYDTGVGIPSLVKERVDNITSSPEALKWALDRGNSTKQLMKGTPRGLGLSDLHSFIELNDGDLHIFTNDIYYQYSNEQQIQYVQKPTIGTFIGITIVADYDHIYTVKQ